MRIDFAFEELPIEVNDGYGAAYVDGVATIDYESSVVWKVAAIIIELDKTVQLEATRKRLLKRVTPSRAVHQIIELALLTDKRWKAEIKRKIDDDIMCRTMSEMVALRHAKIVGAM